VTPPDDTKSLISNGVCLHNGYTAVEAVCPDGTVTYWLWDSELGEDSPPHPGTPRHEQLGPWRPPWRPPPVRNCGRPTATGRPCQHTVFDDSPCWQHR
jgi:hypothetical protein